MVAGQSWDDKTLYHRTEAEKALGNHKWLHKYTAAGIFTFAVVDLPETSVNVKNSSSNIVAQNAIKFVIPSFKFYVTHSPIIGLNYAMYARVIGFKLSLDRIGNIKFHAICTDTSDDDSLFNAYSHFSAHCSGYLETPI